jgi:hypothetical protein
MGFAMTEPCSTRATSERCSLISEDGKWKVWWSAGWDDRISQWAVCRWDGTYSDLVKTYPDTGQDAAEVLAQWEREQVPSSSS